MNFKLEDAQRDAVRASQDDAPIRPTPQLPALQLHHQQEGTHETPRYHVSIQLGVPEKALQLFTYCANIGS